MKEKMIKGIAMMFSGALFIGGLMLIFAYLLIPLLFGGVLIWGLIKLIQLI